MQRAELPVYDLVTGNEKSLSKADIPDAVHNLLKNFGQSLNLKRYTLRVARTVAGPEIFICRYNSGSMGNSSPPVGPRGKVPEAEAVCRHCLQILTAETIKT